MPNGSQGTPAERAAALKAFGEQIAESKAFFDAMSIPADVDNRMAGIRDDLNTLTARVQKLEAANE